MNSFFLHGLAQTQAGPGQVAETIDRLARTPLSSIMIFAAVLTVVRLALAPYLQKIEPHRRSGLYVLVSRVNEFVDAAIYAAVLIFMVVRPFLFQAFSIPSESMVKTLLVGDYIGINKAIYRYSEPKAGDIVVFRPPAYACDPSQLDANGVPRVDFIKRLIGVPGDVIEIRGGKLYRNNQPVDESYENAPSPFDFKLIKRGDEFWPVNIREGTANMPGFVPIARPFEALDAQTQQELLNAKPVAVPPGHLLMMGDNRPASFDGRGWGLIKREDVVGRSDFIWLPVSRWRVTR